MARQEKDLGNVATDFRWENDTFKVWEMVLEPGESCSWHRHGMEYLFVITEPGTIKAEHEDGTSEIVTYAGGEIEPGVKGAIHRVINIGTTRVRSAVIEVKG